MPDQNAITNTTIQLAKTTLRKTEFDVWLAKYVSGHGRRSGSLRLGISEEAFRYRLQQADRKMADALRSAA